ncbi:MAG: HAD-IA family hydrolase [Actinobacteria bacterium]|nr:HAD-IA family hydrolase [Actinomycetota bacterium]
MSRALLFDFDGVLAETLPHHLRAWKQAFRSEPFDPHEMTIKMNEGSKAFQICMAMAKYSGFEIPEGKAKELAHRKNEIFRASNRAKVYPEIPKIIAVAKQYDAKIGLVTGTSLENLQVVLPVGIYNSFDAIITDKDTARGKPFPDPYLMATEKLDVSPGQCIVIENAPMGIDSAKAAGIFCIALMTTLSREHLQKADVIYRNHGELLENIIGLFKELPERMNKKTLDYSDLV